MKKVFAITMVIVLCFALSACGGKTTSDPNDPENIQDELEEMGEDAAGGDAQGYTWPDQATALGVPELKKGQINGLGITENSISIGYSEIKRDDIEAYKSELKTLGYVDGVVFPGDSLWNYVKTENDGVIDITIAFGEDDGGASIIINPTGEKLATLTKPSLKSEWPDTIPKDVPVFSKGTISRVYDNMGLLTLEYKDVTQADVDAYDKALKNAGFVFDEADSSSTSRQYEKEDQATMSVIILATEYKDGLFSIGIAWM